MVCEGCTVYICSTHTVAYFDSSACPQLMKAHKTKPRTHTCMHTHVLSERNSETFWSVHVSIHINIPLCGHPVPHPLLLGTHPADSLIPNLRCYCLLPFVSIINTFQGFQVYQNICIIVNFLASVNKVKSSSYKDALKVMIILLSI